MKAVFAPEASLQLMGGIAVVLNDKNCVDSLLIHWEQQIRVSMLGLCGSVQIKNMKTKFYIWKETQLTTYIIHY